MQDDYKDFTATLLVVGCRIDEATPLIVRDFDQHSRLLRIVCALKKARNGKVLGTPKSRRSRRVVMLPDWAVDMLARLTEGKKPDDLLFTTPAGKQIKSSNYSDRQWKQALKKVRDHEAHHLALSTAHVRVMGADVWCRPAGSPAPPRARIITDHIRSVLLSPARRPGSRCGRHQVATEQRTRITKHQSPVTSSRRRGFLLRPYTCFQTFLIASFHAICIAIIRSST